MSRLGTVWVAPGEGVVTRSRWILVLDTDGILVPAERDALPERVRAFRTQRHAADLATELNADLSAESVEHDFGQGERP